MISISFKQWITIILICCLPLIFILLWLFNFDKAQLIISSKFNGKKETNDASFIEKEILESFDSITICSWSHLDPQKYPIPIYHNFDDIDKYIKPLQLLKEKTGLIFHLSCGSLLGAYRHGGPIPRDGDLDIIVPIWMNLEKLGKEYNYKYKYCSSAIYKLFDSTNFSSNIYDIPGSSRLHNGIHGANEHEKLNQTYLLCGKNQWFWRDVVINYIKQSLPNNSKFYGDRVWGAKWLPHKLSSVDVRININEPDDIHRGGTTSWISTKYNAGPICKCKFGSLYVWCNENAAHPLTALYGKNFMIPNRNISV